MEEVSSAFSFSSHKPSVSPNGQFIAHLNTSKLIIRLSESLERLRSIDLLDILPNNNKNQQYVKISQISWEPFPSNKGCKIAVLLDPIAQIKIFDVLDDNVNITITESDIFGIECFHWLNPVDDQEETAYTGSKQLAVFLKNGLYLKIYSLDYNKEIIQIEKPLFNTVFQRSDKESNDKKELLYHVFSVGETNEIINNCLINYDGSNSEILYKSSIGKFSNLETVKISPMGHWIIANDNQLMGIHLNLFSIIGELSNGKGPIFKYVDDSRDQLGITTSLEFINDDILLFGDFKENINVLTMSNDEGSLSLNEILKHNSNINSNSTKIWRQNFDNTKFHVKKSISASSTLVKLPQLLNLELYDKGVWKLITLKSADDSILIISCVNTLPTTLFIWSNESNEPISVIITNTRIKDFKTIDSIPGFLLVHCEDSIIIWIESITRTPISIPYPNLKGVEIIQESKNLLKLLVWDSEKTFQTLTKKLITSQFDHLNVDEIDQLRKGSPIFTDDLPRVVELAAGVQQSEWGQNTSKNFQNEDTFISKKRQKR